MEAVLYDSKHRKADEIWQYGARLGRIELRFDDSVVIYS